MRQKEREIDGARRKREREGGGGGDDVKWNSRKRLVGLKRSKKSHFQKPGCQKMETNLLWMAGSPAPPVNYTLSAGALPKQCRPLMKEKGNMMGNDFTCRNDKDSSLAFHLQRGRLCMRLTESAFIAV